ncbi:unnamed protein product, partial [Ixodes hexagonus]
MKLSVVTAVAVAVLLLVCVSETDATKHLIFAPFIWAGNIVKDAAQCLVAFKLSIATKLLAMITGNRSFRASIEYDSRLEKYQAAPAPPSGGYSHHLPEVAPRPHPVQVENDIKVDWFPGVKFPQMHMPKFSLPHPHLPSWPKFKLPKLSLPNFSSHFSKFHGKSQLPSASAFLHSPKFASGYINGGFKVGHGAVGGPSFQAAEPAVTPDNATTVALGPPTTRENASRGWCVPWLRNPWVSDSTAGRWCSSSKLSS